MSEVTIIDLDESRIAPLYHINTWNDQPYYAGIYFENCETVQAVYDTSDGTQCDIFEGKSLWFWLPASVNARSANEIMHAHKKNFEKIAAGHYYDYSSQSWELTEEAKAAEYAIECDINHKNYNNELKRDYVYSDPTDIEVWDNGEGLDSETFAKQVMEEYSESLHCRFDFTVDDLAGYFGRHEEFKVTDSEVNEED